MRNAAPHMKVNDENCIFHIVHVFSTRIRESELNENQKEKKKQMNKLIDAYERSSLPWNRT